MKASEAVRFATIWGQELGNCRLTASGRVEREALAPLPGEAIDLEWRDARTPVVLPGDDMVGEIVNGAFVTLATIPGDAWDQPAPTSDDSEDPEPMKPSSEAPELIVIQDALWLRRCLWEQGYGYGLACVEERWVRVHSDVPMGGRPPARMETHPT